jgi:F-type H+-transporting ATPase subunit a
MQKHLADTLGAAVHVAGVVDTAHASAAAHGAGNGDLFGHLLEHLHDSRELDLPFAHIELPHFASIDFFGVTVDLSITKHLVFLWLAAVLLLTAAVAAARKNAKSAVPKGIGNLVEVFLVFVRDEIVIPNMGQAGLKYMPYLLTTFFFILTMNLMGLIPYGASSTGNINVTAGLAIIAFIMIQAAAIREQGLAHYLAHLTGGVHWVLWPIMIPLEVIGHITKAFALCMRLFANMMGGHTVVVSVLGLIFLFGVVWIAPIPTFFVVAIDLLEIFVAFLQAYVFTILTSVFMGLGMQSESHGGERSN